MQFLKQYNHSVLLLLVRIGAGLAFISHGYQKLMTPEMFVDFFTKLGLGGLNMVYFVGAVEFLGGIALILGVYTMYAGALLSIVMIVAILKVHLAQGYSMTATSMGYEYQLLLLLVSLGFIFSGPGKFSLWGGKCGCPKGMCDHKKGSMTCNA
jgi:putative oxidoreductase